MNDASSRYDSDSSSGLEHLYLEDSGSCSPRSHTGPTCAPRALSVSDSNEEHKMPMSMAHAHLQGFNLGASSETAASDASSMMPLTSRRPQPRYSMSYLAASTVSCSVAHILAIKSKWHIIASPSALVLLCSAPAPAKSHQQLCQGMADLHATIASLGLQLNSSGAVSCTASPNKYSTAIQQQQQQLSGNSNSSSSSRHNLQELTQSLARTMTSLESIGTRLSHRPDGRGEGLPDNLLLSQR
jgi:hypothetical protein